MLILLACIREVRKEGPSPEGLAWNRIEEAMAWRPEEEVSSWEEAPDAMKNAEEAILGVLALNPSDMRAGAFLTRLSWYRGSMSWLEGEQEEAARFFRTSLEQGAACLRMEPGFVAIYEAGTASYTAFNLTALPKSSLPCLIWTVAAGTALVDVRGPGASVSLEELPLLVARARLLSGGDADGWVDWTAGRLKVQLGEPGGRELLERANQKDPSCTLFAAELSARYPDSPIASESRSWRAPAWEKLIAGALLKQAQKEYVQREHAQQEHAQEE